MSIIRRVFTDLPQKFLRPFVFRVVEQLFRTALLYDDAAVYDNDGSGDFKRELDFVGHDDHRPAFLRQFAWPRLMTC